MNQITSIFTQLLLAAAQCAKSLFQSEFYNFSIESSQIICDALLICFRDYRINQSPYGLPFIVVLLSALAFSLFYLEVWSVHPIKLIDSGPSLFKRKTIHYPLLKAKKTILLSFLLLITSQCTPDGSIIPYTKQVFINQFDAFISNVEYSKSIWDEKQWQNAEDNFKKYNGAYVDHFKGAA